MSAFRSWWGLPCCYAWVGYRLLVPPSIAWGFAGDYLEIFCVGVTARARLLSVGPWCCLTAAVGPNIFTVAHSS